MVPFILATVAIICSLGLGCIVLVLFTDDAVAASGCIEEGQVW